MVNSAGVTFVCGCAHTHEHTTISYTVHIYCIYHNITISSQCHWMYVNSGCSMYVTNTYKSRKQVVFVRVRLGIWTLEFYHSEKSFI